MEDTNHLVYAFEVIPPTFLLSVLTLRVPALFHDPLEATHDL